MGGVILTTGDAERRAGVSGEYLRRLVREGKLSATRTVSGQHLFEAAEIDRFVSEREQKKQARAALVVANDH